MPLTAQQKDTKPANPLPNNMTDLQYETLYSAQCQIPEFDGIIADMKEDKEGWIQWATSAEPQDEKLPGDWETTISDFQKSIMLKVFRPEKIMFAFKNYVRNHMGDFYVEAQTVTMEGIYADMDAFTPLIFILSTGADPTDALLKFAKDKNYGDRIGMISLGQGQTQKAVNLIHESAENGDWVLL